MPATIASPVDEIEPTSKEPVVLKLPVFEIVNAPAATESVVTLVRLLAIKLPDVLTVIAPLATVRLGKIAPYVIAVHDDAPAIRKPPPLAGTTSDVAPLMRLPPADENVRLLRLDDSLAKAKIVPAVTVEPIVPSDQVAGPDPV